MTPSRTQKACFSTAYGYADAVSERLNVDKKKAISSTSKPVLLSMRRAMTYAHIVAHRMIKAAVSWPG